jgi:arylsulfatase A-like enzyme
MRQQCLKSNSKNGRAVSASRPRQFLISRAHSVIILGTLLCTLAVKFFHALRYHLTDYYFGWILTDVAFLLSVELVLSLLCFRWPKKRTVRLALIIAAVVCAWSVMNAGWLIRTGTQILPRVLLPLFRAPLSTFCIVGVNLVKMPMAAVVLLVPSVVAMGFFVFVLAKPVVPKYDRKRFFIRAVISLALVCAAVGLHLGVSGQSSAQVPTVGLRDNAHLRALKSFLLPGFGSQGEPKREIPSSKEIAIVRTVSTPSQNVVMVVLEGIQYQYTSLGKPGSDSTPYLVRLASEGVEFTNARSCLTHTTKALFALLTGRYPSASQDIAEAVPVAEPYASIATILRDNLGYRTAFFQSAMGSFESRPGLIHNLGFDKFWAREDLGDPNSFLGYLGSDEFSMLQPISQWIGASRQPFFLVVLCSATHDPYEVPLWFGSPMKEPLERYRRAISYTDKFLAALDVELTSLNVVDDTILCVVGDHGEAFGEHGLLGHERIAFEEVLRIPFCVRSLSLLEPGGKMAQPVSSLDVAPTLLGLLGFETECAGFDGDDQFARADNERRVYFCGWMQEGPAGFVKGDRKFVYNPVNKIVHAYDLKSDPRELVRIELPEQRAGELADEITSWRKGTIFWVRQQRTGKETLFEHWSCRWTNRVSSAKYEK